MITIKFRLLILTSFILGGTELVWSQTQHSAYTAVGKGVATPYLRDYQSLGVNPSALGWGTGVKGKSTTMGSTEFGFGISSPSLTKERLQGAAQGIYNTILDKSVEIDVDKQREIAAEYAESGIAVEADFNWFGAYYHNEKLGGIAVAVREKYNWYSQLNEQTSDILFRGNLSGYFDSLTVVLNGDTSRIANSTNLSSDTLAGVIEGRLNNPILLSELTNGSKIKFSWNREYNFGYGRKIIGSDSTFAIYGGIGGRFIQSIAMVDFQSDNNGAQLNASMSPFFGIDYGSVNGTTNISSENNGLLPNITGSGFGFDFSASMIMFNKLRVVAAVNNIGSVKYTQNAYSLRDTLISSVSLPGLDSEDITQSADQLLTGGSILTLQGEKEIVVNNASNFRLGGSFDIAKQFSVGIDVVAPFNRDAPGSLQNAVVSVGGDIKPFPWLQLSVGYFGGGIYANNIPVGINFILGEGAYEFGFASRDAVSFFSKNANSLSFAMGFARIRF